MRNVPALDGLRAVAILSVMAFHAPLRFALGGSLGVDVFFVLSGWLITSILIDEAERTGTIDYAAFLGRRTRRLVPALSVLLIGYIALTPLLVPELASRRWFDAATTALYVTNLRQTFWPADTPLSHTWSLAVEGQFYLLWPFVVLALLRLSRQRAAAVLCIAWAVLTASRFAWQDMIGGPGSYYFSPLHSTGLLLGAALALRPIAWRYGSLALGIVIAIMIGVDTHRWFLVAQPIAEIAVAIVIADPPRILEWPPLRFIGRISYGVYLWHIPLLWVMPSETPLQIMIVCLASLLAGWLSYELVERWFLHSSRPGMAPKADVLAVAGITQTRRP
jgi:peptidoglycan/LPS O-acetylase OafA/YrhL